MIIGLAFGEGGQGVSSMGPAVGDVDRDGRLDVYIPDMGYGCLLMNRGDYFEDRTAPSKLAVVCGQYTGWGGVLFDYDNDGYLDVFVANGNAHHEYTEEDVLMRNDGKGEFVDVARTVGRLLPPEVRRPRRDLRRLRQRRRPRSAGGQPERLAAACCATTAATGGTG